MGTVLCWHDILLLIYEFIIMNYCKSGYMYLEAKGISQNYHKALEFYLKSANQGNAVAQNSIGIHPLSFKSHDNN
jgi:TPR repeat protein